MLSRNPDCYSVISSHTNRNQICNNRRVHTNTDVQGGHLANAPFRTGRCVLVMNRQQVSKTLHLTSEHRRHYCKQDEHSSPSCNTVLGTRHAHEGNPLHLCREFSSLKLPFIWVFLKQKHKFATFVHERLRWTLFDLFPFTSKIK